MTSIITSTVEGVKTEGGVGGFFSGLGKGLVGTVTKPVAGALDFASETAQTVRDMASLSNHRWVESISCIMKNNDSRVQIFQVYRENMEMSREKMMRKDEPITLLKVPIESELIHIDVNGLSALN